MKLVKKIGYTSHYRNESWECEIRDIRKGNEVTSFYIRGRGSGYQAYLIETENRRWLDIPGMNMCSGLSTLDDTFWNSENLGNCLNSIIDGITIANGLKIIYEMEE